MYQVAGKGDNAENIHFANEGHDYGPSKRDAVYKFFAKHLKMKATTEDLDKITIERVHQMEVFNDKHPLPKHAVKGRQAVARAFETVLRAAKE